MILRPDDADERGLLFRTGNQGRFLTIDRAEGVHTLNCCSATGTTHRIEAFPWFGGPEPMGWFALSAPCVEHQWKTPKKETNK